MHLELVRPREQLTELVGWCDGSWADFDEKTKVGYWLFVEVSHTETNSSEQW